MKFTSYFILALCWLLFCDAQGQLVYSLYHSKIRNQKIHSLGTKFKKNHLFHNLEFLNKHSNLNQQSYHLQSQKQKHEHQRIQTFKLKSQISKFSLQLKIGGQNYNMQIDSGSSDIFIKGQDAVGIPQKRYQCGSPCIDKNPHYTLGYLDGRVQTYEKQLEVELGDHKFNESILVAYEVQDNFKDDQGLIGLAYPSRARNHKPNFLQNLINLKLIDSYAFGVNLNFQNKNRSFITFGAYDTQFIQDERIIFFPLNSNQEYLIQVQGISIGNSEVLTIYKALLDTGNTCISIPHQYESNILKQFRSNDDGTTNQCYFSVQKSIEMFSILICKIKNFDILPILSIHINGTKFQIQKQFYLQSCNRKPGQESIQDSKQGVWFCQTYIQSVKRSQLFLGDGFFNRFYTYFDLQNKRIGIGKNKQKNSVQSILKASNELDNEFDPNYEDWKQILQNLQNTEQNMNALNKKYESNNGINWIQKLFADFISFWDTI